MSLLLALVMCLGPLPVRALAAEGEPTLFLDPNQTSTLGAGSAGGWITVPPPGTILGEVIFHMNGAGEDQTVSVVVEDKNVTPPQDPALPGYRFLGWYTGTVGGDQTLVAKWEKSTAAARVTFYSNGGRITEFKGKTVPAPNNGYPFTVDDVAGVDMNGGIGWTNTEDSGQPTALLSVEREGYIFDGWHFNGTGPEANQAYDGKLTDFSKLTKFDPSKKIAGLRELAAKWTVADVCTVTFDYNDGTGKTNRSRLPRAIPSSYRRIRFGQIIHFRAGYPAILREIKL